MIPQPPKGSVIGQTAESELFLLQGHLQCWVAEGPAGELDSPDGPSRRNEVQSQPYRVKNYLTRQLHEEWGFEEE